MSRHAQILGGPHDGCIVELKGTSQAINEAALQGREDWRRYRLRKNAGLPIREKKHARPLDLYVHPELIDRGFIK